MMLKQQRKEIKLSRLMHGGRAEKRGASGGSETNDARAPQAA